MMPIKIILILFLILVLRVFLVQKSMVLTKRVIAFLMFFVLLFLILFPDVSTTAANFIGVRRGVDLIFYLSHFFLLFLIILIWRGTHSLKTTVTELSRTIALQNAVKPDPVRTDGAGDEKTP